MPLTAPMIRFLSLALFVFSLAACNGHSDRSKEPKSQDVVVAEATPAPTPAPTPVPKPPRVPEAFALETENLYNYRKNEIRKLADAEIERKNLADIQGFSAFHPEIRKSEKTGGLISYQTATQVLRAINDNPVTAPWSGKYQRDGVSIGYCFGRATFVHIALKKLGLQTSSIRKVWLVGSMSTGDVDWGFHVATAAFVKDYGWMVIDSNLGSILSVSDWYQYYRPLSKDQRLRIYFTMPNRFGVTISDYNRVDMGLDLSEEKDWYHHYFFDLMAWFRKADFEAMGLHRVEPARESVPASGI